MNKWYMKPFDYITGVHRRPSQLRPFIINFHIESRFPDDMNMKIGHWLCM